MIALQFASNPCRRRLFGGLKKASENLAISGCHWLYLDGSFVTGKPKPNDFDACWDPVGVDPQKLDPVFLDFHNRRAAQKAKFLGEFFPSTRKANAHMSNFIDFFQVEKFTGQSKGIVLIDLTTDCMLKQRGTP
ncbi:MAG: hypothetical protein OXE84_03475 [Rhodobacteraceae bacterium]|nr:hypothetical protein [Paracoccaceae bacterium]